MWYSLVTSGQRWEYDLWGFKTRLRKLEIYDLSTCFSLALSSRYIGGNNMHRHPSESASIDSTYASKRKYAKA